jgi:hypothetical protein
VAPTPALPRHLSQEHRVSYAARSSLRATLVCLLVYLYCTLSDRTRVMVEKRRQNDTNLIKRFIQHSREADAMETDQTSTPAFQANTHTTESPLFPRKPRGGCCAANVAGARAVSGAGSQSWETDQHPAFSCKNTPRIFFGPSSPRPPQRPLLGSHSRSRTRR